MGRCDAADPRGVRGKRPGGALTGDTDRGTGARSESGGPAAGWYPDPGGSGGLRYWSGRHWTDHLAGPGGGSDETAPAEAAPAETAPAEAAPAEQPAAPPPPVPAAPSARPPYQHPAGPWPYRPGDRQQHPWSVPGAGAGPAGQELAGFGRRSAGMLLDLLIVGVAALVAGAAVVAVLVGWDSVIDSGEWAQLIAKTEADPGYQPTEAEALALFGPGAFTAALLVVGMWLLLSFGNGVVLVAGRGQTIGDRAVGTRKVRADGSPPGFGAALGRWAIPALLLVAAPLLGLFTLPLWVLDHLWPLRDARRRTWHDIAAGTVVERADLIGPGNV